MRIVYVTASLPFGPAEAFIVDEVKELLRTHDVLIVPRSPGKLGPHGPGLIEHSYPQSILAPHVLMSAACRAVQRPISTLRSSRCLLRSSSPKVLIRNLVVWPKALWLAHVATEWRADHIHCHWAGTTATMAFIASRLSGIPWSLTAHRSDIVSDNLLREKARSVSMLRAISESGKEMLLERGVEAGTRLQVLPMGVAIPERSCFVPPTKPVILCPADLLEVKGHRYLLRAWTHLQERGIHAELWLAGEGKLNRELHQLSDSLGITGGVKFLGTLPHAVLLDLYAKNVISAVTLASVDMGNGCHEGIPVSLVEAMSYGIPVIATKTGGIPELLRPNSGLLVSSRDPIALADAFQQILSDPVFAQTIGRNGRDHVIRTRNVVSIAATLESFFRNCPTLPV